MERSFTFEPGEFYHVYNRGVDKRKIYFSDGDWVQFQKLLFFRNDADNSMRISRLKDLSLADTERKDVLVDICAYAMLPNHFHLLVKERSGSGISKFMSKLQTSFSKYVNMKYRRTGPLMCRPFRAKHVGNDDYLRWLISYIHLNPLELSSPNWKEEGIGDALKAKQFLSDYQFSSYKDYFVTDRDESHILAKESLPFFIDDLEDVANMQNLYSTLR